jgi:hypothetical protein
MRLLGEGVTLWTMQPSPDDAGGDGMVMNSLEAEAIIQTLEMFEVKEIGGPR